MIDPIWTYKRIDAGMGETDYQILRLGEVAAYCTNYHWALIIINALNRDEGL